MTENRCNTVLVAYSALPKILKDYDSAFRARLQSSFMSAHLQRGVTTEKLVQEMLDINGRKLAMLQLKEIVERAYVLAGVKGPALALFDQLRGCPTRFMTWDWVTALEMALMLSLSLLIPLALRRRDLI